ncbi:ankyrin repeat and protein kinase domain-containing protein 1-like [Saccostrea echinata]|uniref:ankyrin repeat and protein kinase domain-containing protein 1-like n=1 Tax=Saccostrea echinata TaxID=191078 RepID=UPI002A80D389|nr:ankyrin repeat and protein kinase domain-containing protein 1-like [Saccostrea echinata]
MREPEESEYAECYEDIKTNCRRLIILSEIYRVGFYQGQCGKHITIDENKVFAVPQLHQAVFEGNIEDTQCLIKDGQDPNQKLLDGPRFFRCVEDGQKALYGYFEGTTPLMIASQNGHLKLVKFLRSQGAVISKTDSLGFNAFLLACGANQLDVCRYLLSHGASLEFRDELNGMTPLLIACRAGNEAVARWLIDRGANVHACDYSGRGTLHFAAWNYSISLIQLLVSKSVKINGKDRDGNTPLHLMLSNTSLESTALEEVFVQNKEVETVEHILKKMNKLKDVNIIVDFGLTTRRGKADLLNKSSEKWKSLSEFIKIGADSSIKNRDGQTPLHVLLQCLPETFISKGRVVVFEPNRNQELLVQLLILLKLGVDPEVKLGDGRTTIELCQSKKNALAIRILKRYQNIVNDTNANNPVVDQTMANSRQKYLQKLKQVENEIEMLSDMVIEPLRQRSFYEIVYDNCIALYRYVDSIVIG